mmetsp:Transcript_73927/g.220590  ORF Transcript_73927/g.220590 Transcript_73927/m.220590 type:complete len:227 (+) Transcript_73927:479-1159(+)
MASMTSGSLWSSLRCARQMAPDSTASDRKVPSAWASTLSKSRGERPALRMASTMASCMPGPWGVFSEATLPFWFCMHPAMIPMNLSLVFSMTLPSTTWVAPFRPRAAQPSPRTYPSEAALKLAHRPRWEYQPSMQWSFHHMGAIIKWTPIATALSLETARPFFCTDSAATFKQARPDAASVVSEMAGPFVPRQKASRPENIQRLPMMPPMLPLVGWKNHSSVPQPM